MIDYRWTAESIAMASTVLARDVIAAAEHAAKVPGAITAKQSYRLTKLADAVKTAIEGE